MLVPVEGLAPALRLVGRHLDEVIDGSTDDTPDFIRWSLTKGLMQLWLMGRAGQVVAAVVTKIEQRPKCRVMVGCYMWGPDPETWVASLFGACRAAALENGCQMIEMPARRGLVKYMKPLGFRCLAQIYQVDIDG